MATAATFDVTILDDSLDETDELIVVSTSNPVNADLGGFFGLGLVRIIDDDPEPTARPSILVVNPEGDSGSTTWDLPVVLSEPSGATVTIDWTTFDVAENPAVAHPGSDYVAASGTVTFAPGETAATIPIEVIGDTSDEPPLLYGEWGFVQFSNPTNTSVTGGLFGLGVFVIIDDD